MTRYTDSSRSVCQRVSDDNFLLRCENLNSIDATFRNACRAMMTDIFNT